MKIKQFMLFLLVEKTGIMGNDDKYSYPQSLQVDLVNGDVQAFLESIPEDLNENSQLWTVITTMDGRIMSYVDGMSFIHTEEKAGVVYRPMDAENREKMRFDAVTFAGRHLEQNNVDKKKVIYEIGEVIKSCEEALLSPNAHPPLPEIIEILQQMRDDLTLMPIPIRAERERRASSLTHFASDEVDLENIEISIIVTRAMDRYLAVPDD